MDNILLIDFNNTLYKYIQINSFMEFHGKNTGMLFGFITSISHAVNLYKPKKIIICNDSKELKRRSIFPDYKMDRKKYTDDTIYNYIMESKKYCMDFIEKLGITFWEEVGYEADDLIATLTKFNEGSFILTSNDSDLYQLLTPYVSLHKNKGLYTLKDFAVDYPDMKPENMALVQAVVSGNHNNIPAIKKGFGIKTIMQYMKDYTLYKYYLSPYEKQIDFNLKLTTLPFDEDLKEISKEILDKKNICVSVRRIENYLMQSFGIDITTQMSLSFNYLNNLS